MGINQLCQAGIISLFPFLHSCATTHTGNNDKNKTGINQKDKQGFRQGFWVIRDTVRVPVETITQYKSIFIGEIYPVSVRDSLMRLDSIRKSNSHTEVNKQKEIQQTIYVSEGTYVNNMRDGLWIFHKENGVNKSEVRYSHNEIISVTVYNELQQVVIRIIPNYSSDSAYYEKRDSNEKMITGTFPLLLLTSLTNHFLVD